MDQPDRHIKLNVPDRELGDNSITTTKYNLGNFLPVNLYEQFSKLANVYFLVDYTYQIIGMLMMIKSISSTDGKPVVFVPLAFILTVNITKNIVEDFKRKTSDRNENMSQVLVLRQDGFKLNSWTSLMVGQIIKVAKDEMIPADLLLLFSGEEKGNCFIETKNLDGETNLKEKRVSTKLQQLYESGDFIQMNEVRLDFKFERPNPYLYQFTGSLALPDNTELPLDNNSFILRGCTLRNTKYIYGVVTYNGHESKIMLNSVKAQPKMSLLDRMMNRQIVRIVALQMFLCIGFAICSVIYQEINRSQLKYMEYDKDTTFYNSWWISWPIYLGKWLLILNNFIPISLMVSHEMVKYIQAMTIASDEKMDSHLHGKIPTVVQSSSLTEELGQIDYIFSDKTGTLTCNIMDFKKLYVKGEIYGETYQADLENDLYPDIDNVSVREKKLFATLKNTQSEQHTDLNKCLLLLGLCHTALVERSETNSDFKYCVNCA